MSEKRSAFWLVATIIIFALATAVSLWVLSGLVAGGMSITTSGTVLEVRLTGPLAEVQGSGPFASPLTVRELDSAIRRAATDRRVSALYLEVGPFVGGMAKAQEIHAALKVFRESGKPLVALLEIGSGTDLYLASAASTVVQIPTGQLTLGLLMQEAFYKDLLDTLGVQFEAFHSGPFKTAMHSFTRRELSEAQREMSESLLESLYRTWIDEVAEARDLDPELLQAAYDRGVLLAADAMEYGLVDELGYLTDVDALLADAAGSGFDRVSVRRYLQASAAPSFSALLGGSPVIALIHVSGMIVPGDTEDTLFAGNLAAGNTIARYIRQAREDSSVRAIVLRIDSPGGVMSAADIIGHEVQLAAEKKPVIASMSDVAASGGYWIASPATKIFANRATYTGSIGVVMGRVNLAGTYELLGVNNELLKRGENADIFSDAMPLRSEQAQLLERNMLVAYDGFLDWVAEGRGMPRDEVAELAAGRVWTGAQAVDNGLVDEIGGLREAVVAARIEAGIRRGRATMLRIYPPHRTLFEQLSRLLAASTVVAPESLLGSHWEAFEAFHMLRSGAVAWALMDQSLPVPVR
jgi:protease-4